MENFKKIPPNFVSSLRKWFFLNRRLLPWREDPSPYKVWISEVMLQQTQVSTVLPYFNRWMKLFPTLKDLACAPFEQVIKAWEGLGYYSRVRNLHEGAAYLLKKNGGELPQKAKELKKIKGIGPYTLGAILSFAFKQKAIAVDGNVIRVITRLFAIKTPIDRSSTLKQVHQITEVLLPKEEPWVVMEALIELGALICQKKAQCCLCPFKKNCLAYQNKLVEKLPYKEKKTKVTHLYRIVPVIYSQGKVLLKKGDKGKVMADLWEFPSFNLQKPEEMTPYWHLKLEERFSLSLKFIGALSSLSHGFTRYKAFLYPYLFEVKGATSLVIKHHWVSFSQACQKPFSSGHRRIFFELKKRQFNASYNHGLNDDFSA